MILKNSFHNLFVILFLVLIIFFWITSFKEDYRFALAESAIEKIESFYNVNDRYPVNFKEVNLPYGDEGPIFYDINKNKNEYIVSFPGSTLGESIIYRSREKKWIEF
jgi:hypothetical protein